MTTYAVTVNESGPSCSALHQGMESWGCFGKGYFTSNPDRRESRVDQAACLLRLIVAPGLNTGEWYPANCA